MIKHFMNNRPLYISYFQEVLSGITPPFNSPPQAEGKKISLPSGVGDIISPLFEGGQRGEAKRTQLTGKSLYKLENGKIIFNPEKREFFIQNIPPSAFRTYGCPDCNRPLYNEKPRQIPYNYPRVLTEEEHIMAIDLIF